MKMEMITQKILTADGDLYLTNGAVFGKTVVLPVDADVSLWREITQAEKEEMEAAENGI